MEIQSLQNLTTWNELEEYLEEIMTAVYECRSDAYATSYIYASSMRYHH